MCKFDTHFKIGIMKRIFLKLMVFSFILVESGNLLAQSNYLLGMGDYINYSNISRTNSPANVSYENIKGSPFIFDEFETGRIKLKDMKTFEGPLRYDIYANNFEFKTKDGEIYSIVNPETIEKIYVGSRIFIYVVNNEQTNSGNYFEVLVDGEYMLLVKHSAILKDPVPAKPYIEAKPATFVTKDDDFYIMNENSGLVQIKNKEAVIDIDSEKSSEISKFIKEKKIKVSNKSDLIELTNFLNAD
jgi:hypothetical protein